ncbi:MAG: glycoside hydrolase family 36 protein [Aurantibacter sp.]
MTTTKNGIHLQVTGEELRDHVKLYRIIDEDRLQVYEFEYLDEKGEIPSPITVKWKTPAHNIKGMWQPTSDFNKRTQYDWELRPMESCISLDAPVICLFGHDDANCMTFASNDAIHTLSLDAYIREEEDYFYCHITFFTESERPVSNYKTQIRIDFRTVHFSESLKGVSQWWESFKDLKPTSVPVISKRPIYSTWYQFHQSLEQEKLLKECALASDLGYHAVIIDDGWQTKDSSRGYDYTGDWRSDRIPDMADYVGKIHEMGMKVGIWYSVPFCGKKSEAYSRFKGKFLTESHRWAPVFDPRYPEVREYLIGLYSSALKAWDLDGFKLDFIDDFHSYEDTPSGKQDGRDYASINEAVDRLLTDVITDLRAIKPNVFVEFRQKYTGPAMRKYGNMFRAFDCPGDATMNRVRIADLRMLSGNTAVHADMITWHADERVEVAALQLANIMFGVPQLSIMLQDAHPSHLKMIRFFTKYWNKHADILTQGYFIAYKPLANYPVQQVTKDNFTIIGVHDEFVVPIEKVSTNIHLLNAQLADELIIKCVEDFGEFQTKIYDCQGTLVSKDQLALTKGAVAIPIPACGIVQMKKITK